METILPASDTPTDTSSEDRKKRAKQIKSALAATAPVGRTITSLASIMAQHDPEKEITPAHMLAHHTGLALQLASDVKRQAKRGYREQIFADDMAKFDALKRSVTISRASLQDPDVMKQFKADLATLAGDDRTALDINKRMAPTDVARAIDAAVAKKTGPIIIDLATVGIRTTPNTKRVLNQYTEGGREELVAAGLLDRTPSASADRQRSGQGKHNSSDEGHPWSTADAPSTTTKPARRQDKRPHEGMER
jgi:hypothetical protein